MEAEFFETPFAVVAEDKGGDRRGEFDAVVVSAAVDELLFDRAIEAFDAAVGFGFPDEGEAGREAVKAALALEPVREVLAAVIVTPFDAAGGVRGARAKDAGDGLGDGFVGVVAEALGVPYASGAVPQ